MALWSYFGERRSGRSIGSRRLSVPGCRVRSISETLEDVAEEFSDTIIGGDNNSTDSSAQDVSSTGSPAGSYAENNRSRWMAIRTKSVDSGSPVSSLPGRPSWLFARGGSPDHYNGSQQPKPLTTVVGFNNHHVPGAERMRHNSAGSSPRRDNRLIDKNLIEIKGDVVIGCASQSGLSNSVDHDIWIPRINQRRSVERKVF
jgi:hypothetical protein